MRSIHSLSVSLVDCLLNLNLGFHSYVNGICATLGMLT